MTQTTLFDLIEDITNIVLCEVCKQPVDKGTIHSECSDIWMEEIVMKSFKKEEKYVDNKKE